MIVFRTLGTIELTDQSGQPITNVLVGPKRLALLSYLAIANSETFHRRDILLGMLWPETDQERARATLRQTIRFLRTELGPDAIGARGTEEVRINHEALWCDVVAFDTAIAERRLVDALALYRGPLLPGLFVPDAGEFEQWLERERQRLHNAAAKAAGQLIAIAIDANDTDAATTWAHRAHELSPYDEAAARQLIELLAERGDRAGALRVYDTFAQRLHRDLEVAPALETTALAEDLRAQPAPPPRRNGTPVETVAAPSVAIPRKHNRTLITAAVLFLVVSGSALALFAARKRAAEPVSASASIAVLPFVNMGGNQEDEYFSQGMTEELINTLSHVNNLRVTARTSAFAFKGKSEDIRQIGARLGVNDVVEGSVRRMGDSLMITAQLIDVRSGYHVWSESYQRDAREIFQIQKEISRAIVNALQIRLAGNDGIQNNRSPTASIAAYDYYLRGRFLWGQDTRRGLELYRRALEIDPKFALAYAGIADGYVTLADSDLPPAEAYPQAREAALKAVQLDDSLAEAHASLAQVYLFWERDFPSARRELNRALQLNPGSAAVRMVASMLDIWLSTPKEALENLDFAAQLDPMSDYIQSVRLALLMFNKQWDDARGECAHMFRASPNGAYAHACPGLVYLEQGDLARAQQEFKIAFNVPGKKELFWYLAPAAVAYAGTQQADSARRILKELKERSTRQYVSPTQFAIVYGAIGMMDSAYFWLEKGYQTHDSSLLFMDRDELYKPIRSDPRYLPLLRRVRGGDGM